MSACQHKPTYLCSRRLGCVMLTACYTCFSYPPFWALYPQHIVDNSAGTVHRRFILVLRDRLGCSLGLVCEVGFDRLASPRTIEVPRAPVWLTGVPAVFEILLYGMVFPQALVAYLGEGISEHGNGVGAQGGQVVGVEALSLFHAVYVGGGYEGLRVYGVDREDSDEAGEEGAEGEAVAPVAKHGQDEPDEDGGDPEHEDGGVEAQLGQAELLLVEIHALQGGGDDDEEQPDHASGQRLEQTLVGTVLGPEQPVGQEQERERQGGYRDQLEESVAGVFRVGQARRGLHASSAPEQVADLDQDESQEHEIKETEHDSHLDDAERDYPRAWYREVLWDASHQPGPEKARCDPGEKADEEEVGNYIGEVEAEDVDDEPLEDGVGRHEEGSKQQQERGGEQDAA